MSRRSRSFSSSSSSYIDEGGGSTSREATRSRLRRKQKKEYVEKLQNDVENLRKRVRDLQKLYTLQRQKILTRRNDLHGSCVKAISMYNQLFRGGTRAVGSVSHPTQTPRHLLTKATDSAIAISLVEKKKRFMESLVMENMWTSSYVGQGIGAITWFNSWDLVSRLYESVEMNIDSIRVFGTEDKPIVVSDSTLTCVITIDALRQFFPHVLQYQHIVDQLVGQELILHSRAIYHFSKNQSRIEQATSNTDFVYGLYRLLPSLEDVALALPTVTNLAQRVEYVRHQMIEDESVISATTNSACIFEEEEEEKSAAVSNRLSVDFLLS